MVKSKLRRFLSRARYKRSDTPSDNRVLPRFAYLLAFKRGPDEARYRQQEADLLQVQPRTDLMRERLNHAERGATILDPINDIARSDEFSLEARAKPEDVDGLVRLGFRSLLRRDPDPDTYAAYRDGFERGTTFVDLIKDITASDEYQIVEERIENLLAGPPQAPSPMLDHPIANDIEVALTLLEMRLGEKGCSIQLGALPAGAVDGAAALRRMRSLMTTLSLMDRL